MKSSFHHEIKLTFFFILFSVLKMSSSAPTIGSNKSSLECQSLLEKSDTCIRQAFLFGDPNAKFPQSHEEMDYYCGLGQEYTSCVKSYGKCLKPFPRQILYLLIGNMKKLMKETCDSKIKREEFLVHSKCMTPEKIPRVQRVMDKVTIHLNHIAYNVSQDDKIPFICCSFFITRQEIEKEVTDLCSDVTGTATKDYLMKLMEKAVSDAIDLACGKYSSMDVCNKEIPEGMQTLTDIIDDRNFVSQNTSFFVPLIQITKDLDS